MEGSTEMYVYKLARWFFGTLRGTVAEFQELFAAKWHAVCVAWARAETEYFAGMVARQVLRAASTSFAAVAECAAAVDEACATLRDLGLDLVVVCWEALRADLAAELAEHARVWTAQIATDVLGEGWVPVALTDAGRAEYAADLGKCGVVVADDYIRECRCVGRRGCCW